MPKEEFYAGVVLIIVALAIILYDYFHRPMCRYKKVEQVGGALGQTQQDPQKNNGQKSKNPRSLFHRARRLVNQRKQQRPRNFQNKQCCPCINRRRFGKRPRTQNPDEVQPYDDQDQSYNQTEVQPEDQPEDQITTQPEDQPEDQMEDQPEDQMDDAQPEDNLQDEYDGWNDIEATDNSEEQVGGGGYSYLSRAGKKMNRSFRNNWTWPTINSNWMMSGFY